MAGARPIVLAVVAAATLALAAGSAHAGVGGWGPSHGPEGGEVTALVIDPTAPATLYAGTFAGGVFKSTDGGAGWRAVNVGLTESGGVALAIDPVAPATLYAGTDDGGVFKSTDGGRRWRAVNRGLRNRHEIGRASCRERV